MNMRSIGQNMSVSNLNKVAPRKSLAKTKGDNLENRAVEDTATISGKSSRGSEPASTSVLKGFVKAAALHAGVTAIGITGGAFAGAALIGGTVGAVVGGIIGGGAGVGLCAASAKLLEKL